MQGVNYRELKENGVLDGIPVSAVGAMAGNAMSLNILERFLHRVD